MKQIIQDLKTGETVLEKVPLPQVKPGHVLIETSRSLVSAGTERMLVDFGKAGWIEKARQQPEKVSQVLDKMRTDGLVATVEAVFDKLDEPMPMGYLPISAQILCAVILVGLPAFCMAGLPTVLVAGSFR